MRMQKSVWRLNQPNDHHYISCDKQDLGPGVLINGDIHGLLKYVDNIQFQSYCDNNLPVYMATKLTNECSYRYLDSVYSDWERYITTVNSVGGSFQYSIYAVVVSLTANFVITIILSVLIFINIRDKPHVRASRLLKFGALIASINLTIFVIRALKKLSWEHKSKGIVTTYYIMKLFTEDPTFIVLDFLSILIFQLCQVGIVIRLFERTQEKRIIFLVGVLLALLNNILWVIPELAMTTGKVYEAWDILPPFVYLFRIVIVASYACIVVSFIIKKRNFCFRTAQMTLLTLLTVLTVLLLPGFFVADISDIWIEDLAEIFTTTCYVGSTVIVWEWLERLSVVQRNDRAQSVLGRPIFEDEENEYNFAKYALRVQSALARNEASDNTDEGSNTNLASSISGEHFQGTSKVPEVRIDHTSSSTLSKTDTTTVDSGSVDQVKFNNKKSFNDVAQENVSTALKKMVYFTDQIVTKSFGKNALNSSSKSSGGSNERKAIVRKRIGSDRPNEVYVYNTKDVVFESDDDSDSELQNNEHDQRNESEEQ
ncbi:hypothetical protein NCAS_0A09930 [Naumovozyma castellii]|uniref:pH-response regulator protein palH/RIM21 n=1 Tax=Naumovozyma castellii TaxID=27288 RepID=G0V7V3_NAUCA|nr:hypothetical protein NCAS_0A09930 [Naumovozyma castellii CBS 4309]CCC67551.1 hypothetical protein NCAS_0A09930 [Naumovozyma castellii CBS 4309]